jgi:pimeloyl-ACP methyl ester carboxylesterase
VVVIDPRAGQGPGIGGFKPVSEVGNAFKAGHPVYAIGFASDPVEGQTIEDVAQAFTVFLETVIELQPQAAGKPLVFGNCQAGWHAVMAGCIRPDLVGPLVLAGAPLSYWAGVRGKNPMRYTGGLLGGTWLARLTSDLGGGIFDGAWLVSNFDSLNPANTLWTKKYNVWANPEKEEERYLGFEKWWGDFVHLRGEELQYMVDNLFVGNKLSTAQMVTRDGMRLDIRDIKSPILCFCSHGDDITPPQQALDWILDNYDSVDEIRQHQQTILYCLHPTAGHLAIFVGTKVAAKEHSEFVNYMDLIDGMPPGLWEIVITDKTEGEPGGELLEGDFNVRIEERSLEDIRELGCNSAEDEREFEAVNRVSQLNNSLYQTFVQPWVKALVTPQLAASVLAMQPLRLSYAMFSDKNPMMGLASKEADKARANRKTPAADNPFLKVQERVSNLTTKWLEAFGQIRDSMVEAVFHTFYGSPALQAWLGIDPCNERVRPKPGTSPAQRAELAAIVKELRATMDQGGAVEAAVRAHIYVAMGQRSIDARCFEVLRRILKAHPQITLARFKEIVRRQWAMLVIDQSAALKALPHLLPAEPDERRQLFDAMTAVITAAGELDGEAKHRFDQIRVLFDIHAGPAASRGTCVRTPRGSEGNSEAEADRPVSPVAPATGSDTSTRGRAFGAEAGQ